jgi:hypothetical protein
VLSVCLFILAKETPRCLKTLYRCKEVKALLRKGGLAAVDADNGAVVLHKLHGAGDVTLLLQMLPVLVPVLLLFLTW